MDKRWIVAAVLGVVGAAMAQTPPAAALYLISDEASFISGVCIEVDGARCA